MRFLITILVLSTVSCTSKAPSSRENPYVMPTKEERRKIPVSMDEWGLRAMPIHQPLPAYPQRSASRGVTGRVVADVLIGADGKMQAVSIIDTPGEDFSESVRRTLMQWTFHAAYPQSPDGSGREYRPVRSKLTFYFTLDNGRPQVWSPADLALRRRPRPNGREVRIDEIDAAMLKERMRRPGIQLLDISADGAAASGRVPGSKHIPVDDLGVRLPTELSTQQDVIVICGTVAQADCKTTASQLIPFGFPNISIFVQPERARSTTSLQ